MLRSTIGARRVAGEGSSPSVQSGQSLILFALLAVPLLLGLALTADLGMAYAEKRQAQAVADNGAKAANVIIGGYLSSGDFVSGNYSAIDGEVRQAINNVAAYSKAGGVVRDYFGGCPTLAANGQLSLGAEYIDVNVNTVGTVGQGAIPENARGVRVIPCKAVPTKFARVVGINNVAVDARAAVLTDVITEVDTNRSDFLPLVLFGDPDQEDACNENRRGCLNKNSFHITFPGAGDKQWGTCPPDGVILSEEVCGALNIFDLGAAWKGEIDHGKVTADTVHVTSGTTTDVYTYGGKAVGQWWGEKIVTPFLAGQPVIMPVVTSGKGNGDHITLEISSFAVVQILGSPNCSEAPPSSSNAPKSNEPLCVKVIQSSVSGDGLGFGGTQPPPGMPVLVGVRYVQ